MVIKTIFNGCQFALDLGNAPFKKKKYIKELITGSGGQISYILTAKSNYVVVCDGLQSKNTDTYKSRKATSLGVPVVSEKYVECCIAEEVRLDHDDFIVIGEATRQKFEKGIISAPRYEKKEISKQFKLENLNSYKLDSGECEDFGEDFQVVKFAILRKDAEKESQLQLNCVEIHTHCVGNPSAFRVVLYHGKSKGHTEDRVYPVQNSCEAIQCYAALVEQMQRKGLTLVLGLPSGDKVGSTNLIRLLNEMKTSAGHLHPEVLRLVETAWKDSLGELESILSVSPQNVTIDQVRNAAIVLIKIQNALKKDESVSSKYSDEFYKYLPHKENRPIDSLAVVAKKQELCQLLKDVMLAGETAWLSKYSNSALSQYMALKCSLLWVDPQEKDYKLVKDMMSTTEMKITVRSIFHVSRSIERADFREDLPNIKFLFHGSSPANYVGIFSRGLLLPDVVTGQFGGARSDEGHFGSGIYFSNSISTSLQYAVPSQNRGSRLVLLNKVALGKVFETDEKMPGITAPPLGYDSIKGVLSNSMNKLEASDSEFIVYSANQQKMAYLVELTIDDEEVFHHPCTELKIDVQEHQADENVSEVDLNPSIKVVEPGLIAKGKPYSAKLEEVHVRAKVIDMVAEVVIFQAYSNKSPEELEAKYVFPLSEDAAVCGFEAFINDKHVVGIVKEKEQAHREYKQAISEGHGAYLMDQEEPSIFTVNVGNIPPLARVVIKLTYVTELKIAGGCEGCILFSLPGNVSPWKEASTQLFSSMTQATTESVVVSNKGKSSLLISVDMPFNIIDLTSPTHMIVTKRTLSKACVRLSESCCLGQDFTLLVKVAEVHVPRMWVEQNEDDGENQVSMVTFFPEFDIKEVEDYDCLFILDMSNSMHGNPCNQAKALVAPLIDDLPEECSFNVIVFGSNFEEVFLDMRKATDANKSTAKTFISSSSPTRGGSDLFYILQSVKSLRCSPDKLRNIFLFSDGQLSEEEGLKSVAHRIFIESKSQTRVFTFGIGKGVNSHILQKLSLSTGGAYEYFDPGVKRTWKAQLKTQLMKASQPVLTNVWIDWSDLSGCQAEASDGIKHAHAPEKIKCLFNGSQIIAYSFKPYCTQATLHADIRGKKFSAVVTAPTSAMTTGKTLHRLAAKAILKEYEVGVLGESTYAGHLEREFRKESIIALSIKHSIISKYTSFVAIEKREKGEKETLYMKTGPTVSELVDASFVDILPEIQWTGTDVTTEDTIDKLLKKAYQTQSSAIMEARRCVVEAKKAYLSLQSDDPEKRLFISAAACKLGITNSYSDAWKDLKTIILDGNGKLNYDFLNKACRESRDDLNQCLLDVTSKVWPDHCNVRIASFPRSLIPLIVGGFCMLNFSNPGCMDHNRMSMRFWGMMETLEIDGDESIALRKNFMILKSLVITPGLRRNRASTRESRYCSRRLLAVKTAGLGPQPRILTEVSANLSRLFDRVVGGSVGQMTSFSALPEHLSMVGGSGGQASLLGKADASPEQLPVAMVGGSGGQASSLGKTDAMPQQLPVAMVAGSGDQASLLEKADALPPQFVTQPAMVGGSGGQTSLFGKVHVFNHFSGFSAPDAPLRQNRFDSGKLISSASKREYKKKITEKHQDGIQSPAYNPTSPLCFARPQQIASMGRQSLYTANAPAPMPSPHSLMKPATHFTSSANHVECREKSRGIPSDYMLKGLMPFDCLQKGMQKPSSNEARHSMLCEEDWDDFCLDATEGVAQRSKVSYDAIQFCSLGTAHDCCPDMSLESTSSDDDLGMAIEMDTWSIPQHDTYSHNALVTNSLMTRAKCMGIGMGSSILGRPAVCQSGIKDFAATGEQALLESELDPSTCQLWKKLDLGGNLLNRVIKAVNPIGFWSFSLQSNALSSFELACLSAGREVIVEAGASSFGPKVLVDVLDMILTSVVIEFLRLHIDTPIVESMIDKALKWLQQLDNAYPSLYSRLELGSSWHYAAKMVVLKIAQKVLRT